MSNTQPFANDGSFMEAFLKMQQEQKHTAAACCSGERAPAVEPGGQEQPRPIEAAEGAAGPSAVPAATVPITGELDASGLGSSGLGSDRDEYQASSTHTAAPLAAEPALDAKPHQPAHTGQPAKHKPVVLKSNTSIIKALGKRSASDLPATAAKKAAGMRTRTQATGVNARILARHQCYSNWISGRFGLKTRPHMHMLAAQDVQLRTSCICMQTF